MVNGTLKITRKTARRGEAGSRVISVRLKEETVAKLDEIASETNRSRNKLINMLLEYAIDAVEIE